MFTDEFALEIDRAFSCGIRPVRKDFFDLDEDGRVCAGCAVGAAYAHAHPGIKFYHPHEATEWAQRKFNLTADFLDGFLFGFDGLPLPAHYQGLGHAVQGHELGRKLADKYQPVDL